MIIKKSDLYDTISEYCQGEYAIGLHGIDYSRMKQLAKTDSLEGLNDILENGLKVYSGRTIHGTVKFFGRIDIEEDKDKVIEGLNTYRYLSNDYIVVAIPIILKTPEGKKLFLGCPNLDTTSEGIGSTGHEITTLLDEYILDYQDDCSILKPEFILGKYKELEDGNIDFYVNPNHISFKGGVVDQEYFNKIETMINNTLRYYSKMHNIDVDVSIFENFDTINMEKIQPLLDVLYERIINSNAERKMEVPFNETIAQLLIEHLYTKRFKKEELNTDNFNHK